MEIKIVNRSKHPLPEYKTKASAGMDIRANLEETFGKKIDPNRFIYRITRGI